MAKNLWIYAKNIRIMELLFGRRIDNMDITLNEIIISFVIPIICGLLSINSIRRLSKGKIKQFSGSSGVMVGEKHPQPQCLC